MAAALPISDHRPLGWWGIARLGLIQTALAAIVVLATSTFNRVMVVELALPAMLPGALVAFHHALQFLRPRWGWGSDVGGKRAVWIVGGVTILGAGGILAAASVAWMETSYAAGLAGAIAGYFLIGIGVGAGGTSLLALLASRVAPARRAGAATMVWMMMIAGFAVTAGVVGQVLDPYSPERLVMVTAVVAAVAVVVSLLAVWGLDKPARPTHADSAADPAGPESTPKPSFKTALLGVWEDAESRRMALFIFVSMLAYSAQDLILEPFAGTVFHYTPGESTSLASFQHGGVFVGMLLVGLLGSLFKGRLLGSLRLWTVFGCLASAVALSGLVMAALVGPEWPLKGAVLTMGITTGAYAVAAVGSMMGLAGRGEAGHEGIRMGVWGAAQAIGMGLGSFGGTVAVDAVRALGGAPHLAYASVFAAEALLFLASALMAARIADASKTTPADLTTPLGPDLAPETQS
ncbi:BCD family MFS transporter [Roseospirillum parvum]|uniref:MFS transporter, BCD family, chlorophyll transporter n=1 Tax=Roseospirillum parvum TaxID=83401 RepID=A0A1G7WD55_9PROT|nr:BCD family MFS transporter [Roseospirillum parvum]SDG69881.1 MFS transporter, BCD family, chlorophyll transporter [Roseospirillum parvum]